MSVFDQGVHVCGVRAIGSPDSSGDATPTPKTPINEFFPRNGRLTPSPHCPPPRSAVAGLVRGGDAAAYQNLRQIWEGPDRPAQQTSTMSHAVFPASPDSPDDGFTSSQRGVAVPTPPLVDAADVDANDWETGLGRLRLTESIIQTEAAPNTPKGLHGGAYPFVSRSGAASHPTAGSAPQPRRLSIWSTYGTRRSPDNSVRNGGLASMPHPYSSYSAPQPAGSDPASALHHLQSRGSSETSFNASSADVPHAQPASPFLSQLTGPIPWRMGRSPYSSGPNTPDYKAPGGGGSGPDHQQQQPTPFSLQPRHLGFLPMHAIRTFPRPQSPSGLPPGAGIARHQPVPAARFSDRYHGMHTAANASAEHLSAEQNASLWVTNLPPDVTHRELLAQIRHVGRVWCCYINGPDGIQHSTAAAKVVFFHPRAAQRMLQRALVGGGFEIRGYRARVTHNRIKTGETMPRCGDESRVLIVTGQAHFVNERTLTAYFDERFTFQVDEVRELIRGGGRAVVEFRFGSFRCQAQMGKISLEKDRPVGFEKVEFGEDPCEVGETYSAHEVALQRIRGIGL